jgi:dienelactone hydrolase
MLVEQEEYSDLFRKQPSSEAFCLAEHGSVVPPGLFIKKIDRPKTIEEGNKMAIYLRNIRLAAIGYLKDKVKMKHLLVILGLGFVLGSCSISPKPRPPGDLEGMLRPYYKIHRPRGDGPFPAVMVLHGTEGQGAERGQLWAQWLTTLGYVAVEIDSLSPRNLSEHNLLTGTSLWPSERASDVLVTLAYLKRLEYVDHDRIAAVGFSHGASTLLDSLSLAPPQKLPTGLTEAPPGGIDGLRAVIAFYPWCQYPVAHRNGWELKIPVLFLLAGSDTVVSTSHCKEVAESQKANGHPVEYYTYPKATHDFDNPDPARCCRFHPEYTSDAKNRVRRFLGKIMR